MRILIQTNYPVRPGVPFRKSKDGKERVRLAILVAVGTILFYLAGGNGLDWLFSFLGHAGSWVLTHVFGVPPY